jgi:2-polyprenyl-3-methyl-5-hydroxy-6-metoxy-1,4-benzoquinol methylase
MPRTLQPELLDSLPPDHPDALHSRRDLRWINLIMGNHRWFDRTLPRYLRTGERVLELGAGTGELGLRLAPHGVCVDGLDFAPRPAHWFAAHEWHVSDLRHFTGYDRYPAVLANLILHHLTDRELADLGDTLARSARIIVACEPHRSRASQALFALVSPLCGANHVTRHDAHVSIAAGFCGDELPRALGLTSTAWDCHCTTTALGAYHMIALRRP